MMVGNNELRLCEAEMAAAMQMYIDKLMPETRTKVASVKQNATDEYEFIIKLTDED